MTKEKFPVLVGIWEGCCRIAASRGLTLIIIAACLVLSGCVKYDVEVAFDSQTHGEIVQHIKVGERLTAFSSETASAWLDSIERRVRKLRGSTKRISAQEAIARIPFNNGAELAAKFNEFLQPVETRKSSDAAAKAGQEETALPEIASEMGIRQNNLLLVLRNRLSWDLDLTSLGAIAADGNVLIGTGALLDLKFALATPWGARIVTTTAPGETPPGVINLVPEVKDGGRKVIWTLQPGLVNHIEAVFWVPSPIGLGAVAIGLFIAAGYNLRYRLLPAPGGNKTPTPATAHPPVTPS
ncbi:MAG: hypothetical protein Fur0025_21810 [Oscillatoriaceae cyanobacterium]